MKKIIASVAIFLILVVPSVAFANYFPGVINQQQGIFTNQLSNNLTAWTDGDLTTGAVARNNSVATLVLDEPKYLDYFRLESLSSGSLITFYSNETVAEVWNKHSSYKYFEDIQDISTSQPIDKIVISNVSIMSIQEFEIYELLDEIPPQEVADISVETTETTAIFNFSLPTDSDFSHVQIMQGQAVIADNIVDTPYTVEGLEENTEYNFIIHSLDDIGNKSFGVPVNFLTKEVPKPLGEISGLGAEATHERVNLSWQIPQHEKFQHVNIYRAAESGEMFSIMSAPVKIFETNGTYFNDLTVQPETTYTYRLTTYSTEGVESTGVETMVTTSEAPPPVIEGGSYTKDPLTGNFIYSWDSPTYGQVKILLGETEFSTVDASLGQVSIPKNQMKYTAFGDPDVTLIAIDGDKTSEPIRPGMDGQTSGDTIDQLKIPFTAQDLLGTGTGLLWLVAPFVLLALAFLLVPKLRNMLFTAISGKSNTDEQVKDGRTVREGRTYRESAPERSIRVPREKVERQERNMRMPRQLRGERG